jgi:hypothetical protein
LIHKKTQKMFKGWTEKFCVITNAGMIYFNTKKKGDFDPRKFFPLNDFQIKDIDEKVTHPNHSLYLNPLFRLPKESMLSRSFSRERRFLRMFC